MLLLLGQYSGTHEGHVRVVQEVQAERAVQHGADQGLHPGWVILQFPAQPACESHHLCQGWPTAPSLPQQPQEALHPVSGSAPCKQDNSHGDGQRCPLADCTSVHNSARPLTPQVFVTWW